MACNITYIVRNQFDEVQQLIHLPCGSITVELIGKGNSKFTLMQKFDLDHDITVNLDSLYFLYNGTSIEANVKKGNINPRGKSAHITDNFSIELAFDLEERVFEGDSILVYAKNYFNCEGILITMDTICYTFTNTFRVEGLNY